MAARDIAKAPEAEQALTGEQAAEAAGSKLAAALPGFEITIILAIITAILKALGACKNDGPAAVKKTAARGGILARSRLRRAIVEQGAPLSWAETNAAVQASLDLGSEASVEEIRALCTCCE